MDPVPDHGEETYVGHGKLEGRKALITGGDSGIGRAVAIAFAREGADVAISYLAEEQSDAEDTLGWVRRAGRTGVLVPGDLVERETCQQVVADAVEGLGGLDILVNNAGYHWDRGPSGLAGLEPEHVERVLRTNLHAVIWLTQAAEPHLGPGSSIIMTTSIQAYDPSPGPARLRSHQGSHQQPHGQPRGVVGPQGNPGQCRRPRADLDAAPARDP